MANLLIPLAGRDVQDRFPDAQGYMNLQQMSQNMQQKQIGFNLELADVREKLSKKVKEQALAAYDLVKDAPADVRLRRYREAWMDAVGEMEKTGQAHAAGITEDDLVKARTSIPADPESIRASVMPLSQVGKNVNRGPIPTGMEVDPSNPDQYRKVPIAAAYTPEGYQEDPRNPGNFIHTGGAGTKVPLSSVKAEGPAAHGYAVPKGFMPNPDLPGRIMPMPGGPYDPTGDVKPAETALGKINDDEKHGRITKAQADRMRKLAEKEDEWGPPIAVTDKDGNPMLVQQKKGTTELRTVRSARDAPRSGKPEVSIAPKGAKAKDLTVADKMNPVMLATVRTDIAEVRNFLTQVDKFSSDHASAFFDDDQSGNALARYLKKGLTPNEQQQYDTIANRLAVAIASAQSMGRGQLSDAKVREARKLVPVPGDTKANKELKIKQIRRLAEIFEEQLKAPVKPDARTSSDDLKDVLDFWEK